MTVTSEAIKIPGTNHTRQSGAAMAIKYRHPLTMPTGGANHMVYRYVWEIGVANHTVPEDTLLRSSTSTSPTRVPSC